MGKKYREKKNNKVVSVTWSNGNPPQGPVRRIRSTGPAGEVIFISYNYISYKNTNILLQKTTKA